MPLYTLYAITGDWQNRHKVKFPVEDLLLLSFIFIFNIIKNLFHKLPVIPFVHDDTTVLWCDVVAAGVVAAIVTIRSAQISK